MNGPLKTRRERDLFLACCLPFDRVDLVVHIFTVPIISSRGKKKNHDADNVSLRARPPENHAKYQKSSKRVVAIYDFFNA